MKSIAACISPNLRGSAIRRASALASAAADFRPAALRACYASRPTPSTSSAAPAELDGHGDWGSVRGQAGMVASWQSHPLVPAERLALAEALVHRAQDLGFGEAASGGLSLCDAYRVLVETEGGLFGVRSEGTAHCSVVKISDDVFLSTALCDVVALLLRGHAVSLAAPVGAMLDALDALTAEFPPALLQAVEDAPLATIPPTVRAVRATGARAHELWTGQAPPKDFGGVDENGVSHGMSMAATPLALARTDVSMLTQLPRSRYVLDDEVADLGALLSTAPTADAPVAPGLPAPRWARSAYDRGIEEIHDLLDLLWAFREPYVFSGHEDSRGNVGSNQVSVGLAPAHKHFLLTTSGGTEVPEDIVKAAMISAASPYHEPITLHAVGLGARGLTRDPLRSFCRFIQSGKSGLQWSIVEHDSWADFLSWLRDDQSITADPPFLFSTLRGLEPELRRYCAAAGGVAWGPFFVAEPLEQLRRWTTVAVADPSGRNVKLPELRADVTAEVVNPLPRDDE